MARCDGEHNVTHHLCSSTQRCLVLILVKCNTKFLMHSAGGCASKRPREAHSRVGAHSGKLWPYTRNWAKSRAFGSGLSFTRLRYLQEKVCACFTGRLCETCYQLGTVVPFSQGPQIAFPLPSNSSWNVLMTLQLILNNHCITCCVYCHCFVLLEDADWELCLFPQPWR